MFISRGPEAISPTAHYTGYVWARNGLGPGGLATLEGRVAYHAMAPAMALVGALGGPALEGMLLARHRVIDHLLGTAIADGRVGQVVELAAGMSPRGSRFVARFPELTYVETDLPGMLARKRRALGERPARHRLQELDVLSDGLPALDPDVGLAVISEGLLNYLPVDAVTRVWERVAGAEHPDVLHLSDLALGEENRGPLETAFTTGLGVAVRGRIHLHFANAAAAAVVGRAAGFTRFELHRPATFADVLPDVERPGSRNVRVLEAWA